MKTAESAEQIKCPDCGRLNGLEIDVCETCGAHLYVKCRRCAETNVRSDACCRVCGHRLHHSQAHRLKRKVRRLFGPRKLVAAALFVTTMVLLYQFIEHIGQEQNRPPPSYSDGP